MTTSARAASTRRQLLDAARDAFEARGYRATSVADIVGRAATARGTFYLYFRNKDDVFAQLVEEVVAELLDETAVHPDAPDRAASVRAGTRIYLTAFARRRALWRAMLEALGASPAVERQWLALRDGLVERIAANLERGRAAGAVRADLDPVPAAEALAAMVEWSACIAFVVRGEPEEGERFDRMVEGLSSLWLAATAARA